MPSLSIFFTCLTVLINTATVQQPYFESSVQSSMQGVAESVRGSDTASHGFVASALRWYDANMNYVAVGVLMTIESSFIPFPSEVVIPPAVYVASDPHSCSGMKVWLIVLIGTLGAMLGAYVNYFLSRWLGRPVIYRLVDSRMGHLLFLNREKLDRAERYFNEHGNISTLIGRLIPVVRQLISIPAGLAKMNLLHFSLYTFIGAGVWNSVLAFIGYLAFRAADLSVIEKYSRQLSIVILSVAAVVVIYFVVKILCRRKRHE